MKTVLADIVGCCSGSSSSHRVARLGVRAALLILVSSAASVVSAASLTTLYSFTGPDGAWPISGLTLSGSNLYGTTQEGGPYVSFPGVGDGSVFSLPVTGGSLNWSSFFNGSNGWILGCSPRLAISGSSLYGTTNLGTVFRVSVGGGSVTTLCGLGGNPAAGVTLSADELTLYGTVGNSGNGTVFSVPIGGGSATTLASFNGTNGSNPSGAVIRIGSTLYGTTYSGGAYGYGTVYSLPVTGGNPTTLCSFNNTNGANSYSVLTLSGSILFGTTVNGGAYGNGTIFSVPITGGAPTTLFSFSGSNGANPFSGLTLAGSTLYGTTLNGGTYGKGEVFSLPLSGGTVTVLHSFSGPDGANPEGDLTFDANGSTLYGTTHHGGAATGQADGTVFALMIAPPASIALGSPGGATIISGGTAMLGATVSNSAAAGAMNLNYTVAAAVQSGNAALGTVTSATGSLAPSASQTCTVSATSTNLGANAISFTATDPGATNSPQTVAANLTVLDHTAPNLALGSGNSQVVIVGATGVTAGMTLSNGAAGQTGRAALDVNALGTGVTGPTGAALVASGSSQIYTAALATGTLGPQTQTFSLNVGDDHTLSGAAAATNVSATASVTVIDHANASLASTANQTVQTINFGNVLKGAIVPNRNFTIYNRAANAPAFYTANLTLTGFTTSGDPALTTTLAPFGGLAAGGYVTFNASLNTANYTTIGSGTVSLAASQLVDGNALSGAGNNNNGALALVLQGNVGNATADAGNSPTTFGPALTATVAGGGSYANLQSRVVAATGSGGQGRFGSTATLLEGASYRKGDLSRPYSLQARRELMHRS